MDEKYLPRRPSREEYHRNSLWVQGYRISTELTLSSRSLKPGERVTAAKAIFTPATRIVLHPDHIDHANYWFDQYVNGGRYDRVTIRMGSSGEVLRSWDRLKEYQL